MKFCFRISFSLSLSILRQVLPELSIKTGQKLLVSPLKMVLALYKSAFHPKRSDFDGIGQSSTYKDIFSPSQKRRNIFKIYQDKSV